MTLKKYLSFLSIIFLLFGCQIGNDEKIEVLHEGRFVAKARFVHGRRNGKTEIYDSSGKLTGILNYKNDSLSGICIHYFPNGVVSDSVRYQCDKSQGYWRHYNKEGDLSRITYFYFGLQFGPDLWYRKDNILETFYFRNFEKEPLVECLYNAQGNLDSIKKMDLKVVLEDKDKEGSPVVQFFAFLPQIPLTKESYSIGIADKNHVTQKICDIKGENFLIDTLLSAPPPGYHFYLKCDLKANEGGFHDTHMVEMIKTEK
jgi:hypothetical protein